MLEYTSHIINKNEKLSIWNGAASIISNSFISGFVPLFAIGVLQATNQQIALISSLPQLMSIIGMIPGAMWINRLETKKQFTAINVFAARFFLFLMVFVPFITFMNQAWVLVVLIALMNFPNAIATLSWQSLIADIIPDHRRGQFFSERNRILTIVGMIITFVTGILLNMYPKEVAGPYQILFMIAFLFGTLEVAFLLKHIEKKRNTNPVRDKTDVRKIVKMLIRNKPYVAYIGCAVIFNIGWQMAWPLFTIFQINDAKATAFWISLFTVANQISQIISYKWWGKFADRWGNSLMLFIAAVGMATAPFLTVLSTNLYYLTIINLWTGVFVAGTVMLLFNQLLKVSPEQNRTTFLANYNIILGAIGFIAPQIGVLLLELYSMNIAMTISSIIRFLGAVSFLFAAFYFENILKNRFKKVQVES
ncbi:MFS transporter [Bacillus timonensis]|nr:MFS transporter [Bacillus timonensis]